MKLTKQQLKEIIKEEIQNLEEGDDFPSHWTIAQRDVAKAKAEWDRKQRRREWSSSMDPDRQEIDDLYDDSKQIIKDLGDMGDRFTKLSPGSQEALERGLWTPLISYIKVVIDRGRRSRGAPEVDPTRPVSSWTLGPEKKED
tara:strand:- start:24 stop:449 length:426 start_codon:yes stop_codon:yes gene_type:complete